jgi:hypothetical protein
MHGDYPTGLAMCPIRITCYTLQPSFNAFGQVSSLAGRNIYYAHSRSLVTISVHVQSLFREHGGLFGSLCPCACFYHCKDFNEM